MSTAIITSYFSKKKHPNDPSDSHVVGRDSKGKIPNDELNYIRPWYKSVNKLDVQGFIFHDNLSENFVHQHTTDKVEFIKVSESIYSNNDYRFFCFRDFLIEHNFDHVFHADASDVTIVKDPSELVENNPEVDFFACKDSIKLNQFGNYLHIHQHFNFDDQMLFMLNINNWDLINMGVIGGKHENMLEFYTRFTEVRESMGEPEFNSDMWLCQYLLRSQFKDKKFIMGDPVCSEFKKYQNHRKDVYFIHK